MNHALLYLEHLSDEDLLMLAETSGVSREPRRVVNLLRERPELIDDLLAHPEVFRRLFGSGQDPSPYCKVSPFLAFAVLVRRTAADLEGLRFMQEWAGPRRRLPVFDVDDMRRFVADPLRRLYLAQLLASFTRVVSGVAWVRTRRGLRRQRFNELDPVRLASLLDVAAEAERAAIRRRLGDLALFLAGVFPDHVGRQGFSPVELERLARSAGVSAVELLGGRGRRTPEDPTGTIGLLEAMGERWYRIAAQEAPLDTAMRRLLLDVASQIRLPRRILNFMADRYLHRIRADWFPGPTSA